MTDTPAPAIPAASLIPKIIAEHEAITLVVNDAYHDALDYGIKCGEYLTLAKETVEATKPKVAWQAWLKQNLPAIPQTTASLYMRLYENRDFLLEEASSNALLEGVDADLSIRRANELIKKKKANERTPAEQAVIDDRVNKAKTTRAASKAAVTKPGSSGSTSLYDLLPVSDPDEVFMVLTETWDEDRLAELTNRLVNRVAEEEEEEEEKAPSAPAQPALEERRV